MTFLQGLYQLFIGPLGLIFELVFAIVNRLLPNPGYTIIVLSLVVNILVLPLYNRADAMQDEARETDKRLAPMIAHIKKSFKGDERVMMLQTYYKQNNYNPMSTLNVSFSLLLQIPFFMAAYNLLSGMVILRGVSFGPINDLSLPDQILSIGGFSINVLPVLMTLINFIAGYIYLRGKPAKAKIQMYGMAIAFLVLLYGSPSGLAFYWTLNNVFSLFKNLFLKLKHSNLILSISCFAVGVITLIYDLFTCTSASFKVRAFLAMLSVVLALPLFLVKGVIKLPKITSTAEDTKVYVMSCLWITLLTGVLIPSAFIADSPLEFVDVMNMKNPGMYVLVAFISACGMFLVWCTLFYYLASSGVRRVMSGLSFVVAIVFTVDYFFFGKGLGTISTDFVYELRRSCIQRRYHFFVWRVIGSSKSYQ